MEFVFGIVLVLGIIAGGIGGFFIGSGRTIQVSNNQETKVDSKTIQNSAQITLIDNKETKEKLHFIQTNISSWQDLTNLLNQFDDFQKQQCKIITRKDWENGYLIIYPVYDWESKTNTFQTINTNTANTQKLEIK
jgi:hypothetical protein